jgi:2-desacetyl-2-hydroxyethyl bacteriochlorophyllide A dehydrogenase
MRAVRHTEDGIRVVELPEPEPGPGQVVVDVATVGICGSDLHLTDLGPRPITFGHEVGGSVDGRPVAICPLRYCWECRNCRNGVTSLCQVGSNTVVGIHRDGGMADRLVVEEECLVALPEGIDAELAALVEPVAVGVHAMNTVPVEAGMRVAVVGGGTVGLVAAAVARQRGADVDVVARYDRQKAAAERVGAGLEVGRGYDVVVDAAGTESAIREAARLCRAGGSVVIAGTYWGDVLVPGLVIQLKELQLRPAMYYGHHAGEREIDVAARLLLDLPALPEALVTHRFPLDAAPEAWRVAADRASGAVKVLLQL